MNCRVVQSKLSSYLDQESSGREMLVIRRHLDSCPCCSSEFESLVSLKQNTQAMGEAAPPFGYDQRLIEAIRRESSLRPSFAHSRKAPTLSFAAFIGIAAVFAIGVSAFLNSTRPRTLPAHEVASPSEVIDRDQVAVSARDPFGYAPVYVISNSGE